MIHWIANFVAREAGTGTGLAFLLELVRAPWPCALVLWPSSIKGLVFCIENCKHVQGCTLFTCTFLLRNALVLWASLWAVGPFPPFIKPFRNLLN